MTNPYGITLDRAWTEWAAEYGGRLLLRQPYS